MPQVERVGDAPEEAHGRQAQQCRRLGETPGGLPCGRRPGPITWHLPRHPAGLVPVRINRPEPRRDHERRAERWQQCGRPGEPRRFVQDEPREDDHRQPGPAEEWRRPGRDQPARRREGQQRAQRQFPGPGREREERPRLCRVRQPQRDGQRQDERGPEGDCQLPQAGHHVASTERRARREQQQRRPDQVELLLDTETPEMQDRRRCQHGPQVVGGLDRESHVRGIEGRCGGVARDVGHAQRRQDQRGEDDRREERGRGRRQQAPGTARVERREVHPSGGDQLPHEEPCDQEARQDEEHVHAHVAAGDPRHPGVVEQDHEDRDRAESLEVRAEDRLDAHASNHASRSTGAIRAAALDRWEIAFFASADHWPSVSPPGGWDRGSNSGS